MYGLGDTIQELEADNKKLTEENQHLKNRIIELEGKVEFAIRVIKEMTELAAKLT